MSNTVRANLLGPRDTPTTQLMQLEGRCHVVTDTMALLRRSC